MVKNNLYNIADFKLLDVLFEKSGDGVLVANAKTKKFVYANKRICQILGYSKRELLKLCVLDIHRKADLKKVQKEFLKARTGKKKVTEALPVMKKNKEIILCDIGTTSAKINDQEVIIGHFRDVTEKKKFEEELKQNEEKFRDLYENIPGAAYRCVNDKYWTMIFISRGIFDISGYKNFEIIENKSIPYEKLIYPADRNMVRKIVNKSIRGKKVFEIEYRIITKKGDIKWIYEKGKVIIDDNGKIKYIDGLLFDITERRKISEELRSEKDLLQKYLDLVGSMIIILDKSGKIVLVNKKGLEILEAKESEVIGENWFDNFLPKTGRKEVKKVFNKILAGKSKAVEYYENEIITKKGKQKIIFWHNSLLRNDKGEMIALISSGEDITEKKRIENDLIESERKYRTLVEFASDSILLLDTKGKVIEANQAITKILGYSRDYIVGKNISELSSFIPVSSLAIILKNFAKRLLGQKVEPYVVNMISKKGVVGLFEISANVVKNKNKAIAVLAIIRDVTEWESDRQLLKDSELKYRSLISNIPNAVYTTLPDKHRTCIFMSEKWKTWTGFSPEDFYLDKHIWFRAIHPNDRKRVSLVLENSYLAGKPYTLEYRLVHRDLVKVHYILDQGTPNKDSQGKVLSYNGIATNVTRMKLVEKELKESEERFRDISFSSGDIIWEINTKAEYTFVAGDTERLLKYSTKEMLGRSVYEFMPKDEAARIRIIMENLFANQKPIEDLENLCLTRDGRTLIFLVNGSPMFNSDHKCIGYRGVNKDITQRKKAEEEVRVSEEKLKTVVESIGDGVFVLDKDYKVVMFNKQATKISGFSREEVIGKRYDSVLQFVFESSGKVNREFIDQSIRLGNRSDMRNHTQLIRKDGGKVSVADSASPLRDKHGKIIGCVVVFRDISREREIDNMKSEFISVASHQLKTPLSGIKWFTELLLREKVGELNEKQKDFINQIRISNERLVALVTDLLSVSHIETGRKFDIKKEKVNVCQIIERVIESSSQLATKRKVDIIQEKCFSTSMEINVDEEKIQQVFFNLITNALKYSRENTAIFVGAEPSEENIIFFVKDDGIGIEEKDFPKVFTKFYRGDNALKSETDGTGLGLYIAKAIIEAHGGSIWFDSKKDKGSTFYFSIKR